MESGNILLIDEDDDDQLIFRETLKVISFSFACLTASNGIKILNLEKKLPAKIFLDLNMPLMNGVEFRTKIRNHPAFKSIPVYIFSTSNNPVDKVI